MLFGVAYGICIVAGLVEVQAMATPATLAALTGVFWSLTYVGFALPVVLAALAGVAGYPALLLTVAALALTSATVAARRTP